MDPEIKELLEKNLEIAEENNHMLRGLRTASRLAIVWRVFYIAFFIGGAFIAFNFVKPYLEGIQKTYTLLSPQNSIESFKELFGGNSEVDGKSGR